MGPILGGFISEHISWTWLFLANVPIALGGALFCDRRYGKVFVYHNGAESYYAVRGFRGWLAV